MDSVCKEAAPRELTYQATNKQRMECGVDAAEYKHHLGK